MEKLAHITVAGMDAKKYVEEHNKLVDRVNEITALVSEHEETLEDAFSRPNAKEVETDD